MSRVFFHNIYEWNLLHQAIMEGLLPWSESSEYVREQIANGVRIGWINSKNQQRAREFLVFADRVIVPEEDVKPEGPLFDEGHVEMDHMAWNDRHPPIGKVVESARELLPWLSGNIRLTNPDVVEDDLRLGLTYLESREQWQSGFPSFDSVQNMQGVETLEELIQRADRMMETLSRTRPEPPQGNIHEILVRETMFLQRANQLADEGIPALTLPPAVLGPGNANVQPNAEAGAISYFFSGVPIASPRTIAEAVDMRKDPNIQAWRERMSEWAQLMIDDPEKAPERIVQDITISKSALERMAHRVLPWWTIVITGPLDILATSHSLPGAFGFSSLATEVFDRALRAYEKIEDRRRQKHRWIMIGRDHAN